MKTPGAAGPIALTEDEIRRDLVETLFGTPGSFVAGLFGGLMAPISAWIFTRDPVFVVIGGILVVVGLFRTFLMVSHRLASYEQRRRDVDKWELRYGVGAVAFMLMIGATVALLLQEPDNSAANYYGLVIMMGCAGALAGRNAGSPPIVFGQMLSLCVPVAIAALIQPDSRYWALPVLFLLVMVSIKSTTKFLHANLEAALRNGYDARTQRKQFSLALNSMTHGLCMGDANLSITVINRRIIEFFGIVAATTPIRLEALAHSIGRSGSMSPGETQLFAEQWKRHAAMAHANVFTHQIGERFFDFHCERAEGGAFITVVEDVTAQRRALREIERIAHFDDLTGLPNRYQFQDLLEQDLVQIEKRGLQVALINIDLDRFKEVNDTLGHTIGDHLLANVGARLAKCVPAPDMVARLGGDEFCVLVRAANKLPDIDALAATILEELHKPYDIDNHTINIGASIGIALAPRDSQSPVGLLKCSDLALYRSKSGGRGRAVRYSAEMQEALVRKRQIETELRHALANNELIVFYQPIVDSRSATVVCMEALLRWRNPARGMVSPMDFIPIAEETGLIVDIGAWVLRRACEDALLWPNHIRLAVNLSPRQFQQQDLPTMVSHILRETGLPAERLELEITETTLMMDTDDIEGKVRDIEALGVRLSLDDFGTGYSSLGYLNRFPVKKVKIDRSFVRQAIDSPKTQAIIGAITLLARALEIELVAEGVETHAQLAFLASNNIFLIQGYLYSPPRPIAELTPYLSRWEDAPRLNSAA